MSTMMPLRDLPRARPSERWRAAIWVLTVWTLVGLFRAADRYFSDPFQLQRLEFGLWEALAQNLLSSTIWAALTPLVVWLARRSMPTTSNWVKPAGQLAAGGVVFPILHGAAYQLAYPVLMGFPCVPAVQLSALPQLLPLTFPTHFVTYSAIVGVTWALGYSRLSRERDLRASQVKTRLASARLEALKGQLHPHFLFNTLNSILPLVFRDGDAATRTVVRLADLLRLSLQNEGHDLIPFRKELELLRVYLEIQQTRFQDRLTARFELEPGIEDALVPNLILQPLVENAIKHGIAAKPGSGRVEVIARREGPDRIRLIVRDDGAGPSTTVRRTGEGGVGLRNTRDRLELLYGDRHEFRFQGAPQRGCEVSLSFPLTLAPRVEKGPRLEARPQLRVVPRAAGAAVAAVVFLATSAFGASPSGPYARAVTQSQEMLDQVLQLYPGTAVAVAIGDSLVWTQSFGFSDVDRQRHVNRSTQFRIYEAAMPLTATVMARLVEQGRFDADAPIQKYLPDVPETATPVTGRLLASHLGGVRDFDEGEEVAGPCAGARDALRTLKGRLFVRPAGLGHTFSRQGYMLLSAAMEAATGRPFGDLLQETLSGPTGMSSTMIDDPQRFLPGRSNFYERGFLGLLRAARPVDTSCLWGAGGLVSTTEDLVRFAISLLRGELVRRDTLEAMFTPQKTRNGLDTGYGLGWHVETDSQGRRYVWQGGRGVGGRAAIVIVPHVRLVTVMLSNIEGERLDEHARRIAAFFLETAETSGGPPDLIRASGQGQPQPSPPFAYRALPAPGE